MQWLGFYGFDNTYSIAIRKETAEKYQIKLFRILQLSAITLFLVLVMNFLKEDGYDGFQTIYRFTFKEIKEMNLSLNITRSLIIKSMPSRSIEPMEGWKTPILWNWKMIKTIFHQLCVVR